MCLIIWANVFRESLNVKLGHRRVGVLYNKPRLAVTDIRFRSFSGPSLNIEDYPVIVLWDRRHKNRQWTVRDSTTQLSLRRYGTDLSHLVRRRGSIAVTPNKMQTRRRSHHQPMCYFLTRSERRSRMTICHLQRLPVWWVIDGRNWDLHKRNLSNLMLHR